MQAHLLLLGYCVLIVAASMIGGYLPTRVRLTHRSMQMVMSFVGGFMLGVALLHLIPHSLVEGLAIDSAMAWALGGLLFMFLLIRVFHVHQHADLEGDPGHHHGHSHGHSHSHSHAHDHGHSHATPAAGEMALPMAGTPHVHGPDCDHTHEPGHVTAAGSSLNWLGLAIGLSLHTIIDGLALGAAVAAEAHGGHAFALFGLGTFLAVLLHKPLDALTITSLMKAGGWNTKNAMIANACFAVMCPLGAIGFVLGVDNFVGEQAFVIGCALAFAAGVFLCISLADLLPEVTFHSHDRASLTALLLLGVAIAWGIGLVEEPHTHGHGAHSHAADDHGHSHDDHDHEHAPKASPKKP